MDNLYQSILGQYHRPSIDRFLFLGEHHHDSSGDVGNGDDDMVKKYEDDDKNKDYD